MRTFLQLVNYAREECGVSGADLTTLSGVTGQSLRFKNWIINAWKEIQSLHRDWYWMRGEYSFVTTANDGSYTSADAGISTRFLNWDRTYCTCYTTSIGVNDELPLGYLPYEQFRGHYLTGQQTDQRPRHFSIGLANELLIGPRPDSALYTIRGNYEKSSQVLAENDDLPDIPEQEDVIVYRAMKKYARFTGAAEIIDDAIANERRILSDLRIKYLPAVDVGGPLL